MADWNTEGKPPENPLAEQNWFVSHVVTKTAEPLNHEDRLKYIYSEIPLIRPPKIKTFCQLKT